MASAVLKSELEHNVISIDVRDGLSAALVRAESIPAGNTILDSISKETWETMDESESCILIADDECE